MNRKIAVLIALFCMAGMCAQTLTVSQVLEIGSALEENATTSDSYTIEGYVTVITDNSFNTSYNNMTFWIADARGTASTNAQGALLVYRGRPDVELRAGDKIRVVAQLKNYYGTIETNSYNVPVTWLESMPLPDTKGSLRVCAQNLENYYFNLNTGRGNYTQAEFVAKTRKIVNAMLAIDADIYAFCEVEAKPIVLAQLADSMNAHAGVDGRYIPVSDNINEDWNESSNNNIKSGFIYRTDRVATVGNNTGAVSGNGYYAHTMRIQTFSEISSGESFTVSMNHFKAKDSTSDQGEAKRINNANNLVNGLNQHAGDPDVLILGDLNCEYGEAPIDILVAAGYEEQILRFDSSAYSHCYNGGELIDHVMANQSMREQIVNAYVVHVSAYKCTASVSKADSYSDHDPYVVELKLGEQGADGMADVQGGNRQCTKVLHEGHIYLLLPDGSVYNIMGQKIR